MEIVHGRMPFAHALPVRAREGVHFDSEQAERFTREVESVVKLEARFGCDAGDVEAPAQQRSSAQHEDVRFTLRWRLKRY